MRNEEYKVCLEFVARKARRNFPAYVEMMNPPETGFVFSDLHRHLAGLVQKVSNGEVGKRQAVSIPPQHGKSRMLTIEAASWLLGRFPGIQIAITGFSHDLMTDFSKAIKDRIEHPLFRVIFPGSEIVAGSNRSDLWELANGSKLTAKSVGKKLTGRRVDWLIVDDAHAGREEAESETMRRKVTQWFDADCMSRLSPQGTVFVVGTRWHREDLTGYLTSDDRIAGLREDGAEGEIYEVTNLPALCEDPESDPLGRGEGEALIPELRDVAFLRKIKAAIPSYEWSSQYQGHPTISVAGNFERENLRFVSLEDVPSSLELVRGWDIALTEKQTSDYSAACLAGYDAENDHFYIVDMFRAKRSWTKLRSEMLFVSLEDRRRFNVQCVGIEAVGGFGAVYQDVKKALLGEIRVEPRFPPRGGKLLRAQPWLNKIEAKKVFLVRASWNKDFIGELESFPCGNHDDQIDAVSTAWETLTGRFRNGGRRRQVGKRRTIVRRSVRLRRPPNDSPPDEAAA